MTPEHIAAIKARADKATAGPWKPVAQGGSSTIVAPVLPARNDRRSAVSYGYRDDAGYCIGYPFLYQPEPFKSEEQTRMDFVCFSHADADFIAHARTDIPALIAALEAAEAERDTYCAKLVNLADAEVSGLSWGGFNIIGDEKSVKAVQSAVHYSGQIEEYRTAFADRIAALEAERDALKADRETIIRGAMLLEQKLKTELSDAVAKVAKYEMEAFKEAFHKAEAAKLRRSIPILSPGALEDSK